MDERAMRIADAACEGRAPSHDDVLYLLGFDGYSVEAAYVCARARQLGWELCGGVGLIEAQIGVDARPCPENCRYCSFAARNAGTAARAQSLSDAVSAGAPEVPLEEIERYARLFDEQNVHLISLMTTAALPFGRFLEMVRAARAAVAPDMLIMANTRDLSSDEAAALKEAGADIAYHAVRCGEGRLTDIAPERRRETIRNVRAAGLALMCGIEPLWMELDHGELADRIMEVPAFGAFATGACGLTPIAGAPLEGVTPAPRAAIRYVAAIARLVCGRAVRFGGVGGAVWVDAGCDPRARGKGSSREWIVRDIRRARRQLEQDGWRVPDRPDRAWLA